MPKNSAVCFGAKVVMRWYLIKNNKNYCPSFVVNAMVWVEAPSCNYLSYIFVSKHFRFACLFW